MPESKEHIKNLINNIIADNPDGAKEDFHAFLQGKMAATLNPPAPADDEPVDTVDADEPVVDPE